MAEIHPFILSGGAGTRLWPLSRQAYPKQFLKLFGEHSLLQQACQRVSGEGFAAPSILANNEHRFLVGEQLQDIGVDAAAIVLEPYARNTAPATLIAALVTARKDPQGLVLLMPSDHVIPDTALFSSSVQDGVEWAANGHMVTFGITPDGPETAYGYIETEGSETVRGVRRFVEKPNAEVAQEYLEAGNYFWNAGIFLFEANALIGEFERLAPDILDCCRRALEGADDDLDFLRLDPDAYGQNRNISLDFAIMEHAASIKCVPYAGQWSDLGSWSALWEIQDKDDDGNAAQGDVHFTDTRNSFAYSESAALCLLGLDDVFAVATRDAIVVAPKDRAQDVKAVVDAFKRDDRNEVFEHARVYRPWGWYEGLSEGDRFQVKCLMVKPGGRLSLQSHFHRSEHWVVVSGTAKVTVDDKTVLMTENESTYIPLGATHRLENPGKLPAYLIEVQSGRYLGEDDIVRYEDVYNRG